MLVTKTSERKKAKQLLALIDEDDFVKRCESLSKNLHILSKELYSKHKFQDGLVIGGFSPIQKEAHWFKSFAESEFKYSVPHLTSDKHMEYCGVELKRIKSGELGLELSEEFTSNIIVPDILFIPGLAFTKSKERLGRGKGFFDRYLNKFSGVKIGVCFEDQVFEMLVQDEHDVRMDYLVTELNIYK